MDIKLIAVDMDGTLLDDNSEVSRGNIEAIRRLCQKGIITVPVTGRTYNELPSAVRNEECIKYAVFSNGAGIHKKGEGIIYSSPVPAKKAAGILEILDSYEAYVEIYSGGYPWAIKGKINDESFEYYRVNPRFRKVIAHSRRAVSEFAPLVESEALKPELFDAIFRDMNERAECLERLTALYPQAEIVSSMGNNLEIMNRGTNKGTGLQKLCKIISLDINKTLALGDSENDVPMFEAAGLSCAVSNACASLKKIAANTICSNNESVIEYTEKNIL